MDIKSTFFVVITACVVFTACFILIRSKGASIYSIMLKSLASFCFVTCFIVSLVYLTDFNSAYVALGLGLVAGLIGDLLLELKVVYSENSDEYLMSGFVAFGVGHIFYIFAMIALANSIWKINSLVLPIAVAVGVALVLTFATYLLTTKVMKFNFGKNIYATFIYTFVLYATTCMAIAFAICNAKFISLAIGLVLFAVSDLILSMQYFGGKEKNNIMQILNHTTYYIAQIIISSTIFIYMLV